MITCPWVMARVEQIARYNHRPERQGSHQVCEGGRMERIGGSEVGPLHESTGEAGGLHVGTMNMSKPT